MSVCSDVGHDYCSDLEVRSVVALLVGLNSSIHYLSHVLLTLYIQLQELYIRCSRQIGTVVSPIATTSSSVLAAPTSVAGQPTSTFSSSATGVATSSSVAQNVAARLSAP